MAPSNDVVVPLRRWTFSFSLAFALATIAALLVV